MTGRRRRLVGGAVAVFLVLLAWLFVGPEVACHTTVLTNAGGVPYPGPRVCSPLMWIPLVLLVTLVVGWTATLLWALRRRRRGEEAGDEYLVLPR